MRVGRVAVRLDVVLGCVLSVFARVNVVSMCEMRVVRCGFMVSVGVMPGGFAVVARSVLVMLRCLIVMMRCFVRHRGILSCAFSAPEDYGQSERTMGYRDANSR